MDILVIFLLIHEILDQYLFPVSRIPVAAPTEGGDGKPAEPQSDPKKGWIHSLVYALSLILVSLLWGFDSPWIWVAISAGALHFLRTFLGRISGKKPEGKEFWGKHAWEIREVAGLLILLVPVLVLSDNGASPYGDWPGLPEWIDPFSRLVLGAVFLAKPTNEWFRMLFGSFKPRTRFPEPKKAGMWIGTLERFLFLLCFFGGQYAAAGLILTAKSITRYDRISKEPAFAEYYLLGTLFSLLISVLFYLFLFHLI